MNLNSLQTAVNFLQRFIEGRMSYTFGSSDDHSFKEVAYYKDGSPFARFLEKYQPTLDEYVIILLALIPHIQPQFFNNVISKFFPEGGDFPSFGGAKTSSQRSILATGETAQFILAGQDLGKRIEVQQYFCSDHWFAKSHILWLNSPHESEPMMSGALVLDEEIVELLTSGRVTMPRFGSDFPAEHIETTLCWDDIVLPPSTWQQIREIETWIEHNDTLLSKWKMRRVIKPGYRVLFHGPPGVGKTMCAMLLGGENSMSGVKSREKRPVFRIDLSRLVSKYVGETEKNLSRLFDKAEDKNWILLFDEAECLFTRRSDVHHESNGIHTSREVGHLLTRIENYNGLVILSTNQRASIDEAFIRRFQSIIHFPIPGADERYQIWKKSFPSHARLAENVNWMQIAARYELTGSNILSIVQHCSLSALADHTDKIDLPRIENAIRREYVKNGMIV